MNMGENIRRRRLRAGLNQAQLADRVGVSQTSISGIERMGRGSTDTVERIAETLGVPVAVLYAEDDHQAAAIMATRNGAQVAFYVCA